MGRHDDLLEAGPREAPSPRRPRSGRAARDAHRRGSGCASRRVRLRARRVGLGVIALVAVLQIARGVGWLAWLLLDAGPLGIAAAAAELRDAIRERG